VKPHLSLAATLLPCLALAATPPALRLDDSVRPLRYAAELTLLTDAVSFPGVIDIDIEMRRPASLIWLHASDLAIGKATVTSGGRTQTAAIEPGGTDFAGLQFAQAVPAGPAHLRIEYTGKVSDRNTAGVFRGKDAGENYLFTQFEATDARRAFPCFDEPGIKSTWQITVHVKQEHQAISNTPTASQTPEPNRMKRVTFAPTKLLPAYLVAFAVGPFEFVDAGKAGRNRVPVRIVTPKGKRAQAKYAAEVTAPIIEQLEKYFGMPFPFEKADQVAIPLTFGFGAMENAGMVTYAQGLILADPALDTGQRQRQYASVAAHELAHQWFGDLVTMAWWDDTWLNEAFATWMSAKVMATWKPEWNTRLEGLGSKFFAMGEDSLVSTRKIHQPIETTDDIANAFDGITYQKGAAVIRMFESWVGEKQFQAGVSTYLKRYSYANASAGGFLDAIAGTGQPALTRAFSTFLEQPGFPTIGVELDCSGAPKVALTQKRYRPIGSTGSGDEVWQVPVCVRYQTANGPRQECFLLDRPRAEFALRQATGCPSLISANDDSAGYYLTLYPDALLARLVESGSSFLTPAERRTLLHDLRGLAGSGDLKLSRALAAVAGFARAPERQLVEEAKTTAESVLPLVPEALRPNYARFLRTSFGARAASLGWSAKPGEDRESRLERASLVPFVAIRGDDEKLQAEARRLAEGWLRNRQGVDPDMVGGVLTTAAARGNRALFDTLLTELKKTADRGQRRSLIEALGFFRDPGLVQSALELVLSPTVDAREALPLLTGPIGEPGVGQLPFQFVRRHYDQVIERMPSGAGLDGGALLPIVGAGACDAAGRKEFVAFFEERVKKATGGPRRYRQILESIQLCEARKAAHGSDLAEFLAKQ
jgi:cytosol alanyl aminopeptidase